MDTQDKFFILMPWGRVGSNLLVSTLRQSAELGPIPNEPTTGIRSRGSDETAIRREQERWLDEFLTTPAPKMTGAKISVASLLDAFPTFMKRVRAAQARTIFIDRLSVGRTVISQLRAERYAQLHEERWGTPTWAVQKGREIDFSIEVDLPQFSSRAAFLESHRARMYETIDETSLVLTYEELNTHFAQAMERTVDFLGLPPFKYEVKHQKNTPDDLRGVVENLDAVESMCQALGISL